VYPSVHFAKLPEKIKKSEYPTIPSPSKSAQGTGSIVQSIRVRGADVGVAVGLTVGLLVGLTVAVAVGLTVGDVVGEAVGVLEGVAVAVLVGVGTSVGLGAALKLTNSEGSDDGPVLLAASKATTET